jgi:four helix bundle protein
VEGFECGMISIADCGMRIWKTARGKMNADEMKKRTKAFALRIIKMVDSLPKGRTADVIGRQLLRSGTSVGANYRAACRAKSSADFINKMSIVEEETDESIFWMELLVDSGLIGEQQLNGLISEANELLAITVASINTARKGLKK